MRLPVPHEFHVVAPEHPVLARRAAFQGLKRVDDARHVPQSKPSDAIPSDHARPRRVHRNRRHGFPGSMPRVEIHRESSLARVPHPRVSVRVSDDDEGLFRAGAAPIVVGETPERDRLRGSIDERFVIVAALVEIHVPGRVPVRGERRGFEFVSQPAVLAPHEHHSVGVARGDVRRVGGPSQTRRVGGVPAKVTPRRHLGSSAAVVLPQRHESVPTHADETSVGLPADVRHRGDAIGVRRVERLDAVAVCEIPHATLPVARARHETTAVIVERRARQMRRGVRVAIGGVGVVRARVGAGFVRDRARGYAVVVALCRGAFESKLHLAGGRRPRAHHPGLVRGDHLIETRAVTREHDRCVVPLANENVAIYQPPRFGLDASGDELAPLRVERQAAEPVFRVVALLVREGLQAPIRADVPHLYRLAQVQGKDLVLPREREDVAHGRLVAHQARHGAV